MFSVFVGFRVSRLAAALQSLVQDEVISPLPSRTSSFLLADGSLSFIGVCRLQ